MSTIAELIFGALPGSVVTIPAGTYAETLLSTLVNIPSGEPDRPITIRGDGNVLVTASPSTPSYTSLDLRGVHDIICEGISFNRGIRIAEGSRRVRIQNCLSTHREGNGLQLYADECEIISSRFFNCAGHGLYVSGSRNLIEWVNADENAEYGIHLFHSSRDGCNDNIVTNCSARRNGNGILIGSGARNILQQSVAYLNGRAGIMVDFGAVSNIVRHCVSYGNLVGIENGVYSALDTVISKSIFYRNATDYHLASQAATIDNWTTAFGDPLFVDETGGNFNLKPESPCIRSDGYDVGMYPTVRRAEEPAPQPEPAPEPAPPAAPAPAWAEIAASFDALSRLKKGKEREILVNLATLFGGMTS